MSQPHTSNAKERVIFFKNKFKNQVLRNPPKRSLHLSKSNQMLKHSYIFKLVLFRMRFTAFYCVLLRFTAFWTLILLKGSPRKVNKDCSWFKYLFWSNGSIYFCHCLKTSQVLRECLFRIFHFVAAWPHGNVAHKIIWFREYHNNSKYRGSVKIIMYLGLRPSCHAATLPWSK